MPSQTSASLAPVASVAPVALMTPGLDLAGAGPGPSTHLPHRVSEQLPKPPEASRPAGAREMPQVPMLFWNLLAPVTWSRILCCGHHEARLHRHRDRVKGLQQCSPHLHPLELCGCSASGSWGRGRRGGTAPVTSLPVRP